MRLELPIDLCRARSFDTGEWVYGSCYYKDGIWYISSLLKPYGTGFTIRVNSNTIGMAAHGYRAEDSRKVFTGDIVSVLDYMGDPTCGMNRVGLVDWSPRRLAFVIKYTDGEVELFGKEYTDYYSIDVIGNRFENPEMMKDFWYSDY